MMGGKKKYIEIFGSFTEPVNYLPSHGASLMFGLYKITLLVGTCF